ncbi:ribosomal RNA-processing protein 8 [Phlebotomus argentipes]|uniref:ribosomal RNA-processing protein 8 n=1 Tax=Phlebotomus argentipes TaxID=94469 RepID=UPI0028937F01|nr:ribosomal RNA-processing protein 8 [Phlebotomus argentipes]
MSKIFECPEWDCEPKTVVNYNFKKNVNKVKNGRVSKALKSSKGKKKRKHIPEASPEPSCSEPGRFVKLHKEESPKAEVGLRERLIGSLKGSRFRFINEQLYTSQGKDALKIFEEDTTAFKVYHEGYRQQVEQWPLNPLDVLIKAVRKMPKDYVIGDFGCGEARLAKSVPNKVYSLDLVANNADVLACDMANTPLKRNSLNVVVFCLSLMGTNLKDFLLEANRVLKMGGVLKIAEVQSRFSSVKDFIKSVEKCGFKMLDKDLRKNYFYFMTFKKSANVSNSSHLDNFSLKPCLYKKR